MTVLMQVTSVAAPPVAYMNAAFQAGQSSSTYVKFETTWAIGGMHGYSSGLQRLIIEGTGLTYDGSGNLLGGTITKISFVNQSGSSSFFSVRTGYSNTGGGVAFDGLSVSATDFWAAWTASTTSAGVAALRDLLIPAAVVFAGDPTAAPVDGSLTTYTGFERHDTFTAANGDFNDVLLGYSGNDTFVANGGADYVNGGIGNDALIVGDGADLAYGEAGNDSAWGGNGNDILLMGEGIDLAYGGEGADVVYGEAGDDILFGDGAADFIAGGTGLDYGYGGTGNDYLMGEAGNDVMSGDDGDDVTVGGAGDDVLFGGAGTDALFAGAGNDYLIGGAGGDYFYMHSDGVNAGEYDIVGGFDTGSDYLVLSAAVQAATSIFDAGDYTWVTTAVGGSTHTIALIGTTAATVTNQTIWI